VASEVDISNLALASIGDGGTVQSINPPDGSVQAERCGRFYPIARDSLLERHDWEFATRRVALAQLASNPASTWLYCYAQPADCINTIAVLDPNATDDTSAGVTLPSTWGETPMPQRGVYTPQPYALETLPDGTEVVLTNQPNAVLRYVARITDTTKFSPLFTECLAQYLASMIAGPTIKGTEGIRVAAACRALAFGQDGKSGLFGQATASDANQKRTTVRDRQQSAWQR
jgi:hypothetical protein